MSRAFELPELTPDEAAHSERLAERVREEIARAGGWISFARFMAMALYEPGLGYYSAGARKLGAAGDFVTAYAIEWGPVFASGTLILIPVMILTLFLQRYIVRGLTLGAFR